jgi:hypothetical protein
MTKSLYNPQNISDVVITLERTMCYGTCPVYKLVVQGDGLVSYDGEYFVKVIGYQTATVNKGQMRKLLIEFKKARYFALNDRYDSYDCTCMPDTITSLTILGRTKSVFHYHGDCSAPKRLTRLEDAIDRIVGTDRWVKLRDF